MSISQNLKQAMETRNMSQAELSALTGIGKSSISQYLSGKNEPKSKAVEKMADALDVSVAFLNGLTDCSDATNEPGGVRNVPVTVAAKRLDKSEQFIRVGLQRGILPFGVAVKLSSVFTYHISPKLLDAYIGA